RWSAERRNEHVRPNRLNPEPANCPLLGRPLFQLERPALLNGPAFHLRGPLLVSSQSGTTALRIAFVKHLDLCAALQLRESSRFGWRRRNYSACFQLRSGERM